MMKSSNTSIQQIKNITEELCKQQNPENGQWMNQVDETTEVVTALHSDNLGGIEKEDAFTLESAGVALWNYAVGLKARGSLPGIVCAKLRHLSFMMVAFANQGVNDEDTLKKQIIMGMKTGRAWLDAHQSEEAETVLGIANKCAQKLQTVVIDRKNDSRQGGMESIEQQKKDIERDIFKLMCYQAEVAVSLSRNEEAVNLIQMAKERLPLFPKEGSFLSMLCYNFGVDTYQRQQYKETIGWLKESFELAKETKGIQPRNQARTLRLLANAYLEHDPSNSLDKALNAVSLANTEHCHPAGLYLRLRILLTGGEKGAPVAAVLEDIIQHADCTLELGLSVLQLLKQHNGLEIVSDFSARLMKRFERSPDSGKILITQLQTLLQSSSNTQAKQLAEECITAHNTGKPLDINTRKHFHLVFWEQAATAFERSEFEEALTWYNYSMSLFSSSEMNTSNMAKLQRNRASCFLHLQQVNKAKEAAQHAERCDPDETHTQFVIYKIALAEGDHAKASSSLEKMVRGTRGTGNISQSQTFSLISLAAQTALEQNSPDTACKALDFLITHSADNAQVLTALRCLVRLRLAQADTQNFSSTSIGSLIPLIRTAYNKLLVMRQEDKGAPAQLQEEALWFMKIAWNLALKCENDAYSLKDLFSLCLKLLSLLPSDPNLLSRQKTCSLMAAAGCLQVARSVSEEAEQVECLEEALHHIAEFKSLQREHGVTWAQPEGATCADTTDILLLLYEFEARVKLKDSGAESVLERALTMPQPEPKTFEALAALAVEAPACNKALGIRALKVAIRTHLQTDNPDFQRCSKDIHSLIQMSLSLGQTGNKQEAFNYFQETVDVIDKKAKGHYPEIEILWLMTKAWNCGIHFYSSGEYDEAERWCSLSMSLLNYLTSMRANYEEQMNSVYGEVLAQIDQAKGKSNLEE